MAAAKHLLRYLAGTTKYRIQAGGLQTHGVFDAHWGNNPDKRQINVFIHHDDGERASSPQGGTSDADSHVSDGGGAGGSGASNEGNVFCWNIVTEMGFKENFKPIQLFNDNTSSKLFVIGNKTCNAGTKHVALRFFCIRELLKEGKISTHHVPTQDQLVDIRTKHLNKQRHRELINKSTLEPERHRRPCQRFRHLCRH